MKITKKTELIIERERRVTIKFGNASGERFCPCCRERGQFITVDEAALLRQSTARQIFRLVEGDRLHFLEIDNGLLLICLRSLAAVTGEG